MGQGKRLSAVDHGTVRWQLPDELGSGAVARARLRELASRWSLDAVLDELELLTSELVNNAVVHARSRVLLTVRRLRDAVRVEVTDHGGGTPQPGAADSTATSGRGLSMIDAMASDWGTVVDTERTTVWFELSLTRTASREAPRVDGLDAAAAQRAVEGLVRRLLRVTTPEAAVGELVAVVHALGGWTVPASGDDPRALDADLGCGVLQEPLRPAAEAGSPARHHLEQHLPTMIDDTRAVVVQLAGFPRRSARSRRLSRRSPR